MRGQSAAVEAGDDMKADDRHVLRRWRVYVLSVARGAMLLRYFTLPPLLPSAVALLLGCLTALTLPRLPPVWVLWIFLFVGVMLAVALRRASWSGVLLFGFASCCLHGQSGLQHQLPLAFEGRDLVLRGRIVDLPIPETRRTRFLLRVDTDQDQEPALRGRLLQLSWYDEGKTVVPGPRSALHAGSVWQLHVRLRAPRSLVNPGGFDSERYALAQRIVATGYVRVPAMAREVVAPTGVDAWRERMSARIAEAVLSEASVYLRALALGDTRGLSQQDWEVLRGTGLTHLIAISGFHVGMVAGACALVVSWLWRILPSLGRCWPRPLAMALVTVPAAAGYTVLAGASLPTVRTALMIGIVALARLTRRHVMPMHVLGLALFVILIGDPLAILSAGFWLSFAGVAWLLWCMQDGNMAPWRGFLLAQGVATLGLLPFTAGLFGQVSLVGPFANLIAIPLWTFVVVPLALLGTALEALVPGWGTAIWHLGGTCFEWSWQLFEHLAQTSFALWWLPESDGFALGLALLGAFWLLLPRCTPGKWLALLLWLPLLWPDRERPRPGEFEMQVLDVGQGLSIVVRTSGHTLLYDAGPAVKEGFDAGERVVVPVLRASDIRRLDALVASHADSDHVGGLAAVLTAYPVGVSYAPPGAPLNVDRRCSAGDSWMWDGVQFRFLHPASHSTYLGNESSCVLRIDTRWGSALLTGDIGKVVERGLLDQGPENLRADVVVVPHHGSAGSSSVRFVRAVNARLALVSSGHGNRFGHPRCSVVERWRETAEVLLTARSGALRIWIGQQGLQLRERRVWRRRFWDAVERHRSAVILSATEDVSKERRRNETCWNW
ncbi:DNA internalization-related competence protein ComEC/Rec2 [Xylella taiwanensis]|uniref:Transporter n=3 Tax=Xylella taiwanensis TaxID=1444770 RepID=Z9JIJ2_9GAMM|nr:transporter [Xylella taiwanensis]EWS77542.1 transporter [Xylella taiwanensis]NBI37243.1 DNA internalization-related competence protein ComEC/Rec2 [Xylella taiwanensis]QKD99472.1 DNA internalization-related competence protein ComEC/Rec2 [Xylella taiwanensis]